MYCCLCSVYYLSKFDAKLDTITILKFINDDHAEILVLNYTLLEKTKTIYNVEQKLKIMKCMWVYHQVSIISESLYMKTVCRLTRPLNDEVFYKTIVERVRIMIQRHRHKFAPSQKTVSQSQSSHEWLDIKKSTLQP